MKIGRPLLSSAALMLSGAAVLASVPASGKVAQVSANGFVVRHVVALPATPEEAWAVLVKPSVWWAPDHTWSGSAANLSIDPRAGGCFCEVLPGGSSPGASPRGSVEHMRVVYSERPRAIRMSGALGPLQADAVTATLTIQINADEKGGSKLLLEYVVGGFSRTSFEKLAPAVDAMLAEQMRGLSQKLGGAFAAAFPHAAAEGEGAAAPPSASMDPTAGAEAEPAAPASKGDGIVPLSDVPLPSDGSMRGR